MQNHSYARHRLDFVELFSGFPVLWFVALAIAVFTSSGFVRSAFLLSCVSLCEKALTVFSAFPSLVALMQVFIIRPSCLTSCGGRRIASTLRSLVVILGVGWLDWFSIPAWGVGDPGFKSQRPHQTQFCLIVQKQARF